MSASLWRAAVVGALLSALGGAAALSAALMTPLDGRTAGSLQTAEPASMSVPASGTRDTDAQPDPKVAQRDVLRPQRTPAPVRFDPMAATEAGNALPQPPAFTLVGVILGAAPFALVRGLGGVEATVLVSEREEAAGLRLVQVTAQGAVFVWRGDTLRLSLPEGVR